MTITIKKCRTDTVRTRHKDNLHPEDSKDDQNKESLQSHPKKLNIIVIGLFFSVLQACPKMLWCIALFSIVHLLFYINYAHKFELT